MRSQTPGYGPAHRGEARRRILAAASTRFYRQGIAATGVDSITAAAGVAKMSFYNNFRSKDALVTAYLQDRHATLLGFYERRLPAVKNPSQGVLAVFDAYLDHARVDPAGFRGCGLVNAAAELPPGHPGRDLVRAQKQDIEQLLRTHLQELQKGKATAVTQSRVTAGLTAEGLSFLLEGAMVRAGLEGSLAPLRRARSMTALLVDAS